MTENDDYSNAEFAFRVLRERILSGEFPRGSQHSVYRLAEELQLSRTPVREAVIRLADLRLVEIERRRGFTVRGLQVDDIRELFEIRMFLEIPSVERACRSFGDGEIENLRAHLEELEDAAERQDKEAFGVLDQQFHACILRGAKNKRLIELLDEIRTSSRLSGVSSVTEKRTFRQIYLEHKRIFDAIEARDAEAAVAMMQAHLFSTATTLMSEMLRKESGSKAEWEVEGPGWFNNVTHRS